MRDAASDRTAAAFGRIRCGSQWLWEKSADSDGGDGNADDDITMILMMMMLMMEVHHTSAIL